VDQIAQGKGNGVDKCPGVDAESEHQGDFQTGNIGDDLSGNIQRDKNDSSGEIFPFVRVHTSPCGTNPCD